MDHVQRRYKPGSKIGSSGVVERVEQVGDCIMIYFRAAANAVATVYGAIHDAFLFNYRCTLVTNVD